MFFRAISYRPLWLFPVSLIAHGFSGYIYWSIRNDYGAYEKWTIQFFSILVVSCTLSLFVFQSHIFNSKQLNNLVKIGIHSFLLIMLSIPFTSELYIEFFILLIVIAEIALYLSFPISILASFIIIHSIFLTNTISISVWGVVIPSFNHVSLHGLYFLSILFYICFSMMRFHYKIISQHKNTINQLEHSNKELTKSNIGFQHLAIQSKEISETVERKRISRELHDSVGHAFTTIIMLIQASLEVHDSQDDKIDDFLLLAKKQAQVGLQETRNALREIRKMEKNKISGIENIIRLIDVFKKATGIEVFIEYGNISWSFGVIIDKIIFRTIQESLTNSFRHGKASKINISIWQNDKEIILNILDDGQGCKEIIAGIGFSGMKERIHRVNGKIYFRNTESGFKTTVYIPYIVKAENPIIEVCDV